MTDNNVITEETFIQTNINNANSTTSSVDFHTSINRLVNQDTNITTLTFSNDFVESIEYLTGSTENYYDELEDDDISIDEMDDDDQLKINFYRQINTSGNKENLLLGEQDTIYGNIANQISTCPNLEHLIINGSGDWLCNNDYVYFFGELLFRGSRSLKVSKSPISGLRGMYQFLCRKLLSNEVNHGGLPLPTMVMAGRAEAYCTRNRPQGVRITLGNGWLPLDWPQTVQQRLRTSAVARRWWILRITCYNHRRFQDAPSFQAYPPSL